MNLFPEYNNAKPFLKWAGGKTQLIPAIEQILPPGLASQPEFTYVEPFVGSGAIFFWFLKKFQNVTHAIINDLNSDLINAYITIRDNPHELIALLNNIQREYYLITTEEARKEFFYAKRTEYNSRKNDYLLNTSLLIFLNRTCFNGLYRVNSKNEFNVPFGNYKKPRICDADTIIADSNLLQNTTILNVDFEAVLEHVHNPAFFYFDPPYRPISKTSSFNSYAKDAFNDEQQRRLSNFCHHLNNNNHHWLLSNSDPKNNDPDDNFFDEIYADFVITRVDAKRTINCDAAKRGDIKELLISNYPQNPIIL